MSKYHYAHQVCSERHKFKIQTTIVNDLSETYKLGKLVSGLCVHCTVPNQAASWSSWRGVEQTVVDFPKGLTTNPPLSHSYTLRTTAQAVEDAKAFKTEFQKQLTNKLKKTASSNLSNNEMLIIRKKVRDKVRKTKGDQIDIPFLPHIKRENWVPALFHSVLNLAKALDEMFTKFNNLADYILASNEIETPEIAC